MRYLSPGSIFNEPFQPNDQKSIQLGRKKLLAELELGNGDHIEINGFPLTRNDIIDYFGDLQKEHVADYHQAISKDPVLLTFLEKHQIANWDRFRQAPLYDDPAFIRWVSPWFFSAFTAFTAGCFQQMNEDGLTTLVRSALIMTPNDLERAWEFIFDRLRDNISQLEGYLRQERKTGTAVNLTSIYRLMEQTCIKMILSLPENRFGELRDKYAFAMMQACIYTFNKNVKNRYLVRTWMDNAILLAVSEEMKDQLVAKLTEMNHISTRNRKKNVFRWVWVSIVIITVIGNFFTSGDSGSSGSIQQAPVYNPDAADSTGTYHIRSTRGGDSIIHHHLTPEEVDSIFTHPHHAPFQ